MSQGGRQLPNMQTPSALRTPSSAQNLTAVHNVNVRPMDVAKTPMQMKKSMLAILVTGLVTVAYMVLEPPLKSQADQRKLLKVVAPIECATVTDEYKKCLHEKRKKADQCMPVVDAFQRCFFENSSKIVVEQASFK